MEVKYFSFAPCSFTLQTEQRSLFKDLNSLQFEANCRSCSFLILGFKSVDLCHFVYYNIRFKGLQF